MTLNVEMPQLWKKTFVHKGVSFPPAFDASGAEVKCMSASSTTCITLPPDAEEVALAWSKFQRRPNIPSGVMANARKNFWHDFLLMLPTDVCASIRDKHCDFSNIEVAHQQKRCPQKPAKLATTTATANVDGVEVNIQGATVPPAGIFVGRGSYNMFTGRVRRRIVPEDITLNISKGAPIPPVPIPGRKWGDITHDKDADWLAKWRCPVTGKMKYVRLAPEARMLRTEQKFDVVERLLPQLDNIIEKNDKNLRSRDKRARQLATCVSMMLRLGIRLGNASSKNVFGLSTLQVQHVKYHARHQALDIEFIGKDGVPYSKKSWKCPTRQVCKNLCQFIHNKRIDERIFDMVSPRHIEEYVASLAKGLTPKVIRTILANRLFEQELAQIKGMQVSQRQAVQMYKEALLKVADFCNHRTGPDFAKLSPSTSLSNYLHPKRTFNFAKDMGVPPEKLMSKAMLKKFAWAV